MHSGLPEPEGIVHADNGKIFQALFLSYPDALVVADSRGKIVLANRGAVELFGYSAEEIVGINVDTLVPDSARRQHASFRDAYAVAPRARPMGTQMNLVARRKDGSEVMVEIALSPLRSRGYPLVVAAVRDIGGYPRVKQALRRARYSDRLANFGRLAVDARDPAFLLAQVPITAREALEADVAFVFLLDLSRQSFRIAAQAGIDAGLLTDAFPNRLDSMLGFVVQSAGAVATAHSSEARFTFPGIYEGLDLGVGLMVPLMDRGTAVGVLAVHRRVVLRFGDDDVSFLESFSSLASTSLQRAQNEEALGHAQRLETVGQLTGGIAHDFNNLLTIIRGNLQVLEEMPVVARDPLAPQLIVAATRASKRGAELTSKLLAFSRRQRLQPVVIDVGAMLQALSNMLKRTVDQRIQIEVEVSVSCPSIVADPGQLESALLNVAINARDAMPDGGVLRFFASRCAFMPTTIAKELAGTELASAYVEIAVLDSGSGMPDHVKDHAFEPFFTTKEAGRGTGLGLSTVYGFVKQSRGAVALQSTVGEGTRVTMFLPVAPPGEPQATVPVVADITLTKGLRVLLVEDDAEVRAIGLKFLDAMRCTVTAAASGEEAIRILQLSGDFDLLVTDIALGVGMRGTELASIAQGLRPDLKVLLVSGYSADLLDADESSPDSWELLQKPFSKQEFASAIYRVVVVR